MLQLTLLPEVRTTLAAAFRLAGLVRIDFAHDFSVSIKGNDLLDFELADYLQGRLDDAGPGGKITLADPELIFLYTLLDLLGKSYFTSFATVLEREYLQATGATPDAYRDHRDRILGTAGRILAHLGKHLAHRPGFADVQERLALLDDTMS